MKLEVISIDDRFHRINNNNNVNIIPYQFCLANCICSVGHIWVIYFFAEMSSLDGANGGSPKPTYKNHFHENQYKYNVSGQTSASKAISRRTRLNIK